MLYEESAILSPLPNGYRALAEKASSFPQGIIFDGRLQIILKQRQRERGTGCAVSLFQLEIRSRSGAEIL
jgi:hypothetical protein